MVASVRDLAPALIEEAKARALLRTRGPAAFASRWWYYTVELAPGVMARGQYEDDLPMLPRLMLQRVGDLTGASCLDLGSMEGLIPILMRRSGASRILATDHSRFCYAKMRAAQAAYGTLFDFQTVGSMDTLHRKIRGGFDLINCSGLLYHVWSPLHVLAGARSLLHRNGLMIVSTNVVLDDGMRAEFNATGRMQDEPNTFWYPTVALLEYQLRYLRLEPVDALLLPHEQINSHIRYTFDRPSGYLAVLCRAVDTLNADPWATRSAAQSWEYQGLSDWKRADEQPVSSLGDRWRPIALGSGAAVERITDAPQGTHVLRLSDAR